MKKTLLTVLAAIFLAAVSLALIAAFSLTGHALASDSESGNPGDVVCLAIDHCPELPPPDRCDPAGNCEWPGPDDPIVCAMGWPSDEPMPDCPGVYPPPFCGDEGGKVRPLPAPQARIKFPGREDLCWPPPPLCDPTEPGATDPGEAGEVSDSEPGFEGENVWKYRSDEIPPEEGDETVEDPLPCIYPPDYGCFEDESGNVLCVDPPVSVCWGVEGKPGLIACPAAENRPHQRGGKGKAAKAKARAKARAAKARARAKAKKVKAAKAKAKAKTRR